MKLDKHVVDMFTELTKPADDVKMEKTCYGTISVVDGTRYVKLDGSDLLVPAASTVKTSHGDRVTVLMKNHSLTITGNLTAPATDGEGGSSGEAGTAATIEVGTVTTGEAGSLASVTNIGTTSAAVFDFVIPRGDKGEKGDTGPQGPQGEKGDTGTWDGTIPDHQHAVSDITDFPTSLPANGGNADTLDGKDSTDFVQNHKSYISEGSIKDFLLTSNSGCAFVSPNVTDMPIDSYTWWFLRIERPEGSHIAAYAANIGNSAEYRIIYNAASDSWSDWIAINDGGNADTVDGKHASDFALSTNPTIEGEIHLARSGNATTSSSLFAWEDSARIRNTDTSAENMTYTDLVITPNGIYTEAIQDGAYISRTKINDGGNADTVDGKHASDFVQKSGDSMSGNLRMETNQLWFGTGGIVQFCFEDTNGVLNLKNHDLRTIFSADYNGSYATNADTVDGLHANEIASNPNQIINPDFKINQRGQSVYSGQTYTVDGWKCITSTGKVTVGDSGITVTNTKGGECKIQNYVERDLTGKTITLSACIDGTVCKVSGIATTDMITWSKQLKVYFDGGYLLFGSHQVSPPIFFVMLTSSAGKSFTCQWVKLEVGSIATPFTPTDPATELAKCQRYYQIRSTNTISAVDLRPSMRITPTVKQIGSARYAYSAEV